MESLQKHILNIESIKEVYPEPFPYDFSYSKNNKHYANILGVGWRNLLKKLDIGEVITFCINKESDNEKFKDSIYFEIDGKVKILISTSKETIKKEFENFEKTKERSNELKMMKDEAMKKYEKFRTKFEIDGMMTITGENFREYRRLETDARNIHQEFSKFIYDNNFTLSLF